MGDVVSIVGYNQEASVLLAPTERTNVDQIHQVIETISAGGSTDTAIGGSTEVGAGTAAGPSRKACVTHITPTLPNIPATANRQRSARLGVTQKKGAKTIPVNDMPNCG